MVRRTDKFWKFQDDAFCRAWEDRIIPFFQKHIKRIFTVVIDKEAHRDRYGDAAKHPYDYCVEVLVERYRGWLRAMGGRGDVMAESRGGTADKELKRVYRHFLERGTRYRSAQELQNYLTSMEIKLKPKSANIAGLQIADLIAYPSKIEIMQANGHQPMNPPSLATRRIIERIQSKYNQWGRKFIG